MYFTRFCSLRQDLSVKQDESLKRLLRFRTENRIFFGNGTKYAHKNKALILNPETVSNTENLLTVKILVKECFGV